MKKIFTSIITAVLALSTAISTQASPAYPYPIKYTQPDGSVITIQIHGDEFLHWTTSGNSLVAQDSEGYWRYATFNSDGTSNAQGSRVSANLSGDGSTVTPPASAIAEAMQKRESMMARSASLAQSSSISLGEKHFLILLIQFSNKSFNTAKADFEAMLNGESYTYNNAVGSVMKYYSDVSNDQFKPIFDVYGPITVPYTSAACAQSDMPAVKYACQYADENYNVDFTQYCNANSGLVDNVFFFFPGYNQAEGGGEDCIWPHAVTYNTPFTTLDGKGIYHYGCTSEYKGHSGATRAGIGTFCHEFGHVIGLPDFYDTDYEGNGGEGDGLFSYSIMSNGNYNNEGRTPPYMTTIERNILGWKTEIPLLKDGDYTLTGVQDNEGYMTETENPNEYFIFEARNKTGWDAYIPAAGLLIYHVDRSRGWDNRYKEHPAVYFKAANPTTINPPKSYGADVPYPGSSEQTTFDNQSPSKARSWADVWNGDQLSNITYSSKQVKFKYHKVTNIRTITGIIYNAVSNDPIPGVKVKMTYKDSKGSSQTITATSNSQGYYGLQAQEVSSNDFKITISDSQYLTQIEDDVTVTENLTKDFYLYPKVSDTGLLFKRYRNTSCSGYTFPSASQIFSTIRFTKEELEPYVGEKITCVNLLPYGDFTRLSAVVYFGSTRVAMETVDKSIITNNLEFLPVGLSDAPEIPANTDIYVGYWMEGATNVLVDKGTPNPNGWFYRTKETYNWSSDGETGSLMVSFVVGGKTFDQMYNYGFSGLGLEPGKTYTKNQSIPLSIVSSNDPVTSVTYYLDGEVVSSTITPTEEGDHEIKAVVSYTSGKTETIIQVIKVQ